MAWAQSLHYVRYERQIRMAEIPITRIIDIREPHGFKLHAARWNGEHEPLDVYVRSKQEWFDWNRWRYSKNEFSRQYIFSLIDFYPETDMWLFGGIYEVVKRNNIPHSYSYEIEELSEYSAYVGRLKVKLRHLRTYRRRQRRSQRLQGHFTCELLTP